VQIAFGRDYAAGFATAVEKWFWGPLGCGENLPKESFDKSNSLLDTTNFAERKRNISIKFEHTQNQNNSLAVELKDPRPAPFGNGEPEERLWPHAHATSGYGKNPWLPL